MSSSPAADALKGFTPKPALDYAAKVGLQAGGFGLFISALQTAFGKHNHGAMGVVTRTGGTIGFFAAMGATFAFTEATVRNSREEDDAWNGAAGGCAAGFLAGLRAKSLPASFAGCIALGATMGVYDYSGQLAGVQESRDEKRARFFKKPPKPIFEAEPASE
ncbi:hypothetical protein CC1G_10542 [Coprinopsis cinerea okayama7|uniref:Uncharacterized protein n=1 Tax=Coprinopsis cinerea (strain Okayama-7 / 130 / ATCC MYA-4618 / FGSC 9003) TaxID=240176 RepID=A8N1C1_COPC7|nr:hypothetical protein CC1G_10542 [Coprinopsis cinerea okayama7\|eukprot:XP_001828670.1 hypothetical protein CC1G_10542 [Coprinopsis cinerea okayama7\